MFAADLATSSVTRACTWNGSISGRCEEQFRPWQASSCSPEARFSCHADCTPASHIIRRGVEAIGGIRPVPLAYPAARAAAPGRFVARPPEGLGDRLARLPCAVLRFARGWYPSLGTVGCRMICPLASGTGGAHDQAASAMPRAGGPVDRWPARAIITAHRTSEAAAWWATTTCVRERGCRACSARCSLARRRSSSRRGGPV